MIRITYLNGKTYTYKTKDYFVDCFVDWDSPTLGLREDLFNSRGEKIMSIPIKEPKLAYREVIAVEDIEDDVTIVYKNPNFKVVVDSKIRTRRQKMKEETYFNLEYSRLKSAVEEEYSNILNGEKSAYPIQKYWDECSELPSPLFFGGTAGGGMAYPGTYAMVGDDNA